MTQCARIARQFNYAEGVKRIYPVLREYVGDENLDLMSGVLYELIEIPVDFQWEEGGMFQRWKHDHRKRDVSLKFACPSQDVLADSWAAEFRASLYPCTR